MAALFPGDFGGDFDGVAAGYPHIFAEAAVDLEAGAGSGNAVVLESLAAVVAEAAALGGVARYVVAPPQPGYLRSHPHDFAGRLVAGNVGQGHRGDQTAGDFQVGGAQAIGDHADEHVPRSDLGFGDFLPGEGSVVLLQNHCFHWGWVLWWFCSCREVESCFIYHDFRQPFCPPLPWNLPPPRLRTPGLWRSCSPGSTAAAHQTREYEADGPVLPR